MPDEPKTEQERQFAKFQREITVATREQGDDPDHNFRLRMVLERARDENMPESMIDAALQMGRGDLPAPDYQEKIYEGYGTDGIAVLVRAITDDPSTTASELEHLFEEHGGNLGDEGCVAWQFERRGLVLVDAQGVDDSDAFLLEVIEMGGEEMVEPISDSAEDASYRVYCDPNDLHEVDETLAASYPVRSTAIVYEPSQPVPVEPAVARKFLGFFEKLLARDDVQQAHANWTFA